MVGRWFTILVALLFLAGAVPVGAVVTPGDPVQPHGYPQYYTDATGLSLDLCIEEPMCSIPDPIEEGNEFSELIGFGEEAFWFLAEAEMRNLPPAPGRDDGRALLVLALEATFGGDEAIRDGNQIAFGRVRVRIDIAEAGDYRVIHPYNTAETALVFENVPAGRRAINYTEDIGGVNPGDPAAAFSGAGASKITHFLTWPDYLEEDSLKREIPLLDENGNPLLDENDAPIVRVEQYIGNPGVDHMITGSPTDNNVFRIERLVNGNWELYAETELFSVQGRVWGDELGELKEVYVNVPEKRLLADGPVNREVAYSQSFFGTVTDGQITGVLYEGYPKGYPLWYSENLGTLEDPEEGLMLTLCPPGHPMCISDPIDFTEPGSVELGIGEEAFWWSADAEINEDVQGQVTGTVPAGFDAELGLALEAAFGADEAIEDGNQVAFGRVRIRIDIPVAGDYTIIHPYGAITFENVPAGGGSINYTQDIGGVNPFDPDAAFGGTLHSTIGPRFLTWTTFDLEDLENMPAELVKDEIFFDEGGNEVLRTVYYVGDPAIPHEVKGGSFVEDANEEVNYFRVIGPGGIDVRTDLFAVTGKVFDLDTFQVLVPDTIPIANPDSATTIGTEPVTINVLANDTLAGELIDPSLVTVEIVDAPAANQGTAVVNPDNTVIFTADSAFTGDSIFTYKVVVDDTTLAESDPAQVTVTVLPEEVISADRARLDTRKLRWDIRGNGNITAEGGDIEVRLGSATGTLIGTATVENGRWRLRATTNTAPPAGTVAIFVISESASYGPFSVQVR